MLSDAEVAYVVWEARRDESLVDLSTGLPYEKSVCSMAMSKLNQLIIGEWAKEEFVRQKEKNVLKSKAN